jgi:ribosomal protein S18 acetylase RimI-like enzyme
MIGSQFRIRRATAEDIPALCGCGRGLIRHHHAYDPLRFTAPESTDEPYARLYGELMAREDTIILAAEAGEEVIGYALVRSEPGSFLDQIDASAWVHEIFVDARVRGRKVGDMLMQAALAWARESGSRGIMLKVAVGNVGAKRLFEKYGFRVTAHEMRLELLEEPGPDAGTKAR